ncbi:MAG: AcrR family transcriptional regulator [Patiriisocius sp.]
MKSATQTNLNERRSLQTQKRLVDATIQSLVEQGFSRTTGVEICRRAELTRGAMNHHYPDLADLYIAALQSVYQTLGTGDEALEECGPLESLLLNSYQRIVQPEFKVVIELWLASRNDPEFGSQLAKAIAAGSSMFSPKTVLSSADLSRQPELAVTYRMIQETLIGLGLGRVVDNGSAVGHEKQVVQMLLQLARSADKKIK